MRHNNKVTTHNDYVMIPNNLENMSNEDFLNLLA